MKHGLEGSSYSCGQVPEVYELLPLVICIPLPILLPMPDVSTRVAHNPVQPIQIYIGLLQEQHQRHRHTD